MPKPRVVPTDRQKARAPGAAPVDTSGVDPEMMATIRGEQQRRANAKSIFAPFAALFAAKKPTAAKVVKKVGR